MKYRIVLDALGMYTLQLEGLYIFRSRSLPSVKRAAHDHGLREVEVVHADRRDTCSCLKCGIVYCA